VSELAPALPLFAMWRRYKLACLAAAETAADLAAIMKTAGPAIEQPADFKDVDPIPIHHRVLMALPNGWDVTQMKTEQPPNTLEMFERSILQEMARSLNVPYNVASGSSAGYNFASGKLDYQIYGKAITVERHYWEINCLDRIFGAWLDEARLIPGFMPDGIDLRLLPHQWFWDDVRPDLDPTKSANALATNLSVGATTLPREYARQGLDWEVEQERGAEALGLSIDEYREALLQGIFGAKPESMSEMEMEDDEAEA
jgi:capsid protein